MRTSEILSKIEKIKLSEILSKENLEIVGVKTEMDYKGANIVLKISEKRSSKDDPN